MREDAGELTDQLANASWVIGHLSSLPAAEDAYASTPASGCRCADLALDLQLAADHDNTYLTMLARKQASTPGKHPRHVGSCGGH